MEDRRADTYRFTDANAGKSFTSNKPIVVIYGFRRDLIVSVLEFQFDSDKGQRSTYTPPWLGASLKDYLLGYGAKGIAEVDSWIQKIKAANT